MDAAKRKRKFRLFGRKKAKTMEVLPPVPPSPPPSLPRVVEVDSPGGISEMSHGTADMQRGRQNPKNLLPGFDDNQSATIIFEDNSTQRSPMTPRKTFVPKARPPPGKSSWLSRTKFFTDMSDWAFTVVDTDGSGAVDEKELYSGLLLIHLKLGSYAGPAACKPVDRQRVHDVFLKMDVDGSGALDRDEFREVMTVLCSNVLTRVLVQWSMTLIIVPLVAQGILDVLYFLNHKIWAFVMDLDDYSPIMAALEDHLEDLKEIALEKTPAIILRYGSHARDLLARVPESIWSTVPLTLVSCILGCVLVPYLLFKIDDFFQSLADKKKTRLLRR